MYVCMYVCMCVCVCVCTYQILARPSQKKTKKKQEKSAAYAESARWLPDCIDPVYLLRSLIGSSAEKEVVLKAWSAFWSELGRNWSL
jgi:hypothetical protein